MRVEKVRGDFALSRVEGEAGGGRGWCRVHKYASYIYALCWLPGDVGGVGAGAHFCGFCVSSVASALVTLAADGTSVVWVVGAAQGGGDDVVCFGAVGLARLVVVEGCSADGAGGDAGGLVSCEDFAAEVSVGCEAGSRFCHWGPPAVVSGCGERPWLLNFGRTGRP